MSEGSSAAADEKFGVLGQCNTKAWPTFPRQCSSLGDGSRRQRLDKAPIFFTPVHRAKINRSIIMCLLQTLPYCCGSVFVLGQKE